LAPHESVKAMLSTVNFATPAVTAGSFEQNGRMLDAILCAVSDHISIFDRDHRLLYIGPASARVLGLERAAMIGKTGSELGITVKFSERFQSEREQVFTSGESFFGTVGYPTVDGLCFFEYTISPLFDPKGRIEAVLHNGRDVTEARNFQLALKQSEERYRALVEASSQYVWTTSATGEALTAAPSLLAFMGLTEEEASDHGWLQVVHPDDRDRSRHIWQQAVAARCACVIEHRFRRNDGEYRDCTSRCVPVLDAGGNIREWVGTLTDITERKQAERDLATRAAVLQNMAEGVVMVEENGRIAFTNPAFDRMFGYEQDELLGQFTSILNDCPPDESNRIVTGIRNRLQEHGEWVGEFHNRRKDGTPFVTSARISRMLIEGRVHRVSVQADITETKRDAHQTEAANQWLWDANRKLEEQVIINQRQSRELEIQKAELESINRKLEIMNTHLAAEAVTDGLTGLKNHRAFQEHLATVYEQSTRYRRPLSVLLLDVDGFKPLNDSFGHLSGDEVLKGVATVLEASARKTDFVARHGGDEFVVILPETAAEGAVSIAERIRATVVEHAWEQRAITVSIGVATLTAKMNSHTNLLEAADKALYSSKAQGRNAVTLFESESMEA
jgi:diguanylate cyclase (GGDEF)-like protein/PAS domain S-box-containing protein